MINFEDRLKRLKDRRQGTRVQAVFDSALTEQQKYSFESNNIDIRQKELFETLKESAGVRYTIGAMSAVDEKSTQVSINEGNRVADNLVSRLKAHDIHVSKRLQGSVALDIHIKGHSDVDMLIIINNPILIEHPLIHPNGYSAASDDRLMVDIVKELRIKSEQILPNSFPKVNVNTSGSKSIALEGGSLARKVDIVPSCWYDCRQYQASKSEHDRGIHIYHKDNHELALNYPFTHINMVNSKDDEYSGNLKCVIRLMKNMIADMPDYKKRDAKKLSSYDLAAIAYHMNESLRIPSYMRLGLVEKTRSHLEFLLSYENYRNLLSVPDGTRKIFNDNEKIKALEILTKETGDLAESIFKELKPFAVRYDPSIILGKSINDNNTRIGYGLSQRNRMG